VTTSIGTLQAVPALDRPDLLAPPVLQALNAWPSGKTGVDEVLVAEIDPDLADTAAFCEKYEVGLDVSANCVVVAGRRGENTTLAACVILATTRADVNGFVRKRIDARKASFAPMDTAVELTGMEYGGITPVGLPADWPLLVDQRVVETDAVIIGSGVRRSKLLLPGRALADLPGAQVAAELAIPV
jgi:prolyl-tRNA editing enzyme YbaK/EbsC (Cys-tRNA(Pro) deacylase)